MFILCDFYYRDIIITCCLCNHYFLITNKGIISLSYNTNNKIFAIVLNLGIVLIISSEKVGYLGFAIRNE